MVMHTEETNGTGMTVGGVLEYMQAHRKILGIRVAALIEMLMFFSMLLLIDTLLGSGARFFTVVPHPCWIILLLVTVQYGLSEALLCAVLSTMFLLAWNLPVQAVTDTMYDYVLKIMYQPFLWILAATILGGIRTRQLNERAVLRENVHSSDDQAKIITQAYKRLMQQKENLERRLAEELHSVVTVYRAAKSLETLDRREMNQAIKNIMITTLNPGKFSMFELTPDPNQPQLVMQLNHGWGKSEPYSSSFVAESSLFQAVIQQKRMLCVVNAEDEPILLGEGLMAGPIIDAATHKIFGMLKIEDHGVLGMSMRNIETFRILCEWVGMVYVNASRYEQALEGGITQQESQLLSPTLLHYQERFLAAFAVRLGFNLFRITLAITVSKELFDENYRTILGKTAEIVRSCIRATDQLFKGDQPEELVVIATCLHAEDVELIIEKIQLALITQSNELLRKINFTYDVQKLHMKLTSREASDVKTAS
jgi:hypothetical protein